MQPPEITVERLIHGLDGATSLPAGKRIRQLGVLDESGTLVGLLSVADLLAAIEHGAAGELAALLREKNAALALSREREALAGKVFEATPEPIPITDAEGRFTHHAAVYGDTAPADRQAGRLRHRWTHDALTGLPDRGQLIETLGDAVRRARAAGQVPAVAVVGLDRFRVLNDTFGLTVGDEILRIAAHRIRECVPADGTVARLVGDEFAVLLPDAGDAKALQALAAAILDSLARPADVDGQEIYLTASMGVALQPGTADAPADADAILQAAGCALHAAKRAGRNTVHIATGGQEQRARRAFTIETELHHALERDELRLHYQPKIDLESLRVVGMEALVRWQHPTRGLVPPDEFIAVAEACGLIVPIGNWVLESACAQTRTWVEQGMGDVQVAVNISAWQFRSDLFERQVQRALERTGLPPRHLELELTESIALDDTGRSIRTMQALRDMGLDLAIDDFGTGYSSLSYVQRLPVTTVKIDRSFIRELDRQATGSAIPRAIITMAHHLGLRVVAEGIETYGHLDMLLFDGCDQGQGYYFSKPLPAADFAAFCRSPRPAERAHCR
ncbi:EAL domain-containing protein [Azospirillum sp. TSO22-1]|uniref:putative bifunctional diguanylate cyclase/phosphodiesterase n=1 Tax=Azospirillum sp. TSO22-1 TaxID=716789 RepID=UPI001304B7B6|nr:EAL domain-containing protein [Azospirillum sp. TSO22-1]